MKFVIRSRYCQPKGIGWVTKDAGVSHDPSYALVFDNEAEAWDYLLANADRLMGHDEEGEYAWPEEAREYSREERQAILDEHDRAHRAYYHRDEEPQ